MRAVVIVVGIAALATVISVCAFLLKPPVEIVAADPLSAVVDSPQEPAAEHKDDRRLPEATKDESRERAAGEVPKDFEPAGVRRFVERINPMALEPGLVGQFERYPDFEVTQVVDGLNALITPYVFSEGAAATKVYGLTFWLTGVHTASMVDGSRVDLTAGKYEVIGTKKYKTGLSQRTVFLVKPADD